jgi:hypothetical protein
MYRMMQGSRSPFAHTDKERKTIPGAAGAVKEIPGSNLGPETSYTD